MIDDESVKKIDKVTKLAREAAILEVNTRKPGNITPEHNFKDTTYKDFLLGCDALKPSIKKTALNGFKADRELIRFSRIGLGKNIKKAVSDVKESHVGGNTHLGIIMLYIPLAAAAGMCISQDTDFRKHLRINLKKCIMLSSVNDSIDLYDAICFSGMSGLGEEDLDVRDDKSKTELKRRNINLEQLMKLSASRDTIASELASGLEIVFEVGVPTLERFHAMTKDLDASIIQTYLILLSRFPDSLIIRKKGRAVAEKVSGKAKDVLEAGGVITGVGLDAIKEFDKYLRSDGNKLNPGTTADLIAATLYVSLMYSEEEFRK